MPSAGSLSVTWGRCQSPRLRRWLRAAIGPEAYKIFIPTVSGTISTVGPFGDDGVALRYTGVILYTGGVTFRGKPLVRLHGDSPNKKMKKVRCPPFYLKNGENTGQKRLGS